MEPDLTQEQQAQAMWNEEAAILEKPADESRPVEPVVAEAPEPAPAAEPEVAADPYAGMPDAVREKLANFDKMAERMRNLEGAIGGLNGRQKEIQNMLAASQAAAKQVQDAPTQAAVKAAMVTPEKWAALKEDFPEWSEAVESFVESRVAGVQPSQIDPREIEKMVQERLAHATPALRREMAEDFLESQFENWKTTVKTPEFAAWVGKQGDDVKRLVHSDRISDAAKLLRMYSVPADPGQAIKDRRQQQLQQAAALPKGTKPTPTKSYEDMTDEEKWNYEAALTEKRRASRY